MDVIRHNLSFSLKLLYKGKGFTATALITLALCIGANSAVFSAVNALILRPLPYDEADRLVVIFNHYPRAEVERQGSSVAAYLARRESIDAFEDIAGFAYTGRTIGEEGKPERIFTLSITPSFLPLLRVEPILGRNFAEDETQPEKANVVILGWEFWQGRYAGADTVLGQEMRIDGDVYTIVGVLPRGFRHLDEWPAEVYVPVRFSEDSMRMERLHSAMMGNLARLAPGATIEQAEEQLAAVEDRLLDEYPLPNGRQLIEETGFYTSVLTLQDALMERRRPVFMLLMAGVLLVLLIGSVNIAHLMVARLNVRRLELATRIALGANRRQLYGQVLTESLVLAVAGGLLSLVVALGGLQVMNMLRVNEIPFGETIRLDLSVMLFTLLISIGTGVFFGTIPVFQILRTDLHTVFRYDGRTVTSGRRAVRHRNLMAIIQVATAFILLVGSGLLVTSFQRLSRVDPGIADPETILNGFIALPESRYPDGESQRQFTGRLLEEVRVLPGVIDAGITSRLPFVTFENTNVMIPDDYVLREGESVIAHRQAFISPGYFKTMGIPLLRGRDFDDRDTEDSNKVIIIDSWMAEHYWPGEDPIGKRLYDGAPGTPQDEQEKDLLYTVIGVVGSVRYSDLYEPEAGGRGAHYRTYRQVPTNFMLLAIRAGVEPLSLVPTVQKAVNDIDPDLPFYLPTTLEERISEKLGEPLIPVVLITIFAGLALFLAATGLFGVLAYSVTRRTREIGIRLAIGGSSREIFRMILTDGLWILSIGLGLGLIAIFVLAPLIRSQLFAIEPTNLIVIGIMIVVVSLVTLLACVIPARKATRVDPVAAINYE